MDQFGVHMDFLQIKQVLTFIYVLKNYFLNSFPGFINYQGWASNTGKRRGSTIKIPETQITNTWMAG
jgi:hypothetical protein